MRKIVIWMLVFAMLATLGMGIVLAEEELSGHLVVLGCDSDQNELGEQFDRFREAYPGITVDYSNLTSEKYAELFTAMKSAGEQIDVMYLNAQDLRRYATAGDLIDLSDIDYKDRFRPVAIDTYTINGKLWAVARGSIGGFNVYYNKALLEKYGFEYPEYHLRHWHGSGQDGDIAVSGGAHQSKAGGDDGDAHGAVHAGGHVLCRGRPVVGMDF